MMIDLLKSVLHNIGVIIVGFVVAFIGLAIDTLFHLPNITISIISLAGVVLLIGGFLIRVWATYRFYEHDMRVIVLHAQEHLITDGPFAYSRNPLYLGGNVFIFFGACFILGTISGIGLTCLGLIATDRMIHREESQLAEKFGDEWAAYAKRVRRWL